MPLYEYQCKKCKHRFEKIQKFSDRPLKKCPECGGPVEQLLHAPAVQFKGSGWYVTDYAGKKEPAASADGSAEKSDKDKKEPAPSSKEHSGKEKDSDSKAKKPETRKAKE